jgi:hypothetical protein
MMPCDHWVPALGPGSDSPTYPLPTHRLWGVRTDLQVQSCPTHLTPGIKFCPTHRSGAAACPMLVQSWGPHTPNSDLLDVRDQQALRLLVCFRCPGR